MKSLKIPRLIIEDYPNLNEIDASDCKLDNLIIRNCPNLIKLNVCRNNLTSLEFIKDLEKLLNLEINGNEEISSGLKYLPNNLNKFTYKGTKLFKLLESHNQDWKARKKYLQEKGIIEEQDNLKELISLKEENKILSEKYSILKNNVDEMKKITEEKLNLLSNRIPSNDLSTKAIISELRKNIEAITNENQKIKDELEHFKPLFSEEEPIVEAKKLGEGSFGTVYKGVWKTQFAAVKKAFANATDEKELAKIKKELKILKNLRSSYTIQYYGEYQKETDIYLIMEYAEHGSLTKFITDNKDKDHDWQLNFNFIKQIVKGLRYLHSEGVLHRDLKSHNILITEGYIAKLADFGLAKLLNSSNYSSSGKKIAGTLRWLAPEVLRSDDHSYQSDIYSLGMVMWEIASKNTLPFKDLDNNNVVIFQVGGNNLREIIPSDAPSELVKIISFCWRADPSERISLSDIESELNKLVVEKPQLEAVIEVKN